jgi:hypothetical protein
MIYCVHRYDITTNNLEVESPTGTKVVVPADRLQGDLLLLTQPAYNALWKSSELTRQQMQELVDDAEEIHPGPGVNIGDIKRRTLDERLAARCGHCRLEHPEDPNACMPHNTLDCPIPTGLHNITVACNYCPGYTQYKQREQEDRLFHERYKNCVCGGTPDDYRYHMCPVHGG